MCWMPCVWLSHHLPELWERFQDTMPMVTKELQQALSTPVQYGTLSYEHAAQNSERAAMGRDCIGHDELWAPRLTYRFYRKHLVSLKQELFDLAKSFVDIQGSKKAQAAFQRTQLAAQLQIEGIEPRIRLLTAPSSGKLAMLVLQIAEYTPVLRAKRNLIQNLIINAKIKIARNVNYDPKIFLDALAIIAFAPEGFNIAAQSASGLYKVATTDQSMDGQPVEKLYVISQFGDAVSNPCPRAI